MEDLAVRRTRRRFVGGLYPGNSRGDLEPPMRGLLLGPYYCGIGQPKGPAQARPVCSVHHQAITNLNPGMDPSGHNTGLQTNPEAEVPNRWRNGASRTDSGASRPSPSPRKALASKPTESHCSRIA